MQHRAEMPLAVDVIRTLRSGATPREAKLQLANALLDAGPGSLFPHRLRFLLDWLCGGLKAQGSDSPPCVDARYWRLLLALLSPEGSSLSGDEQGLSVALLPGSLREGLNQCNRLLLKAAAAAWDAVVREGDVELSALVRQVMRRLLLQCAAEVRPGLEAVTEYAQHTATACAACLQGLAAGGYAGGSCSTAHSGAVGAAAARVHAARELLGAAGEAMRAVLALQRESPPRRALQQFTTRQLRPTLELHAGCREAQAIAAAAVAPGGDRAGKAAAAEAAEVAAALAALAGEAAAACEQVEIALEAALLPPGLVPEWVAALRSPSAALRLQHAPSTAAGTAPPQAPAVTSAPPAEKKRKHGGGGGGGGGEAGSGEGGGGEAEGGGSYVGQLLAELARLGEEDVATGAGATGAGATGAGQPEATSGGPSGQGGGGRGEAAWERGLLLLPLLPALVRGYARAVAGQRQALEEQRASRAQLAGRWWGEAETEAEAGLPSDFLWAALLLRLPLGWLEASLTSLAAAQRPAAAAEPSKARAAEDGAAEGGEAEGAARGRVVAARAARREEQVAQLDRAARAACACAAVLEAVLCSGVYRPRQDWDAQQRAQLQPLLLPALRLGTLARASTPKGGGTSGAEPGLGLDSLLWAAQGAARRGACRLLEVLLRLDSRLLRPQLGESLRLLAASPPAALAAAVTPYAAPAAASPPPEATLLLRLVSVYAVERQLPALLAALAALSARAGVAQGGIVACVPFWRELASRAAHAPPMQAAGLCTPLLAALRAARRSLAAAAATAAAAAATPDLAAEM